MESVIESNALIHLESGVPIDVAMNMLTHEKQILIRHPKRSVCSYILNLAERWGAGVETQKNVRGEIGGWGRVPFNETYAPSLSTIYDGA